MKIEDYNQGKNAGRKSGAFNLGTNRSPVKLGPNNVLDLLLDMSMVADESRSFLDEEDDVTYAIIRTSATKSGKIISVIARVTPDPGK